MPEDQGVNGDIWNDEAARLLTALGWNQIGDSNMDIRNSEEKPVGVDRIFTFEDVRRNNRIPQSVFVEAKRYHSDNFSKGEFHKWIVALSNKITKCRDSAGLYHKFPMLRETVMRNGLIVIWFSNIAEYEQYRPVFQKLKAEIKLPRVGKQASNSIYVIDNFDVLRLASLHRSTKDFNTDNNTSLKFYYPPSDDIKGNVDRKDELTLDYMLSKIILMEGVVENIENRVVFYFGNLSIHDFSRLRSFLQTVSFLDKDKPLHIYTYERDQDFRKIRPSIVKEFAQVKCEFHEMEKFLDLPPFMKK